eukprot:CAMPEP_0184679358 /NCGR_PEP_ID=MMETSP0312-20130426/2192_1 /TAXON_ID=31354 /ORGANISM="Compsopogon coeruleus, Strain SAG 36.94" /LENGTH=426 /DNA_ID=CAMNT_0027128749 /DNA_START=77 /DNA_END=1357 /DNA_ORIENTATION=-
MLRNSSHSSPEDGTPSLGPRRLSRNGSGLFPSGAAIKESWTSSSLSARRAVYIAVYVTVIVVFALASTRFGFRHAEFSRRALPVFERKKDIELLMVAPLLTPSEKTTPRQVRAIHSWLQLRPAPRVYLAAETETDYVTFIRELSKKHVDLTRIERVAVDWREFDDPLLVRVRLPTISSIIERVLERGRSIPSTRNKVYVYINSDMVLFEEFVHAARYGAALGEYKRFLVVGERLELFMTDLDAVDSSKSSSSPVKTVPLPQLRDRSQKDGVWRGRWAVDYFVFGPETWERIPPFVIGRPRFDNWLVANARGVRLDATDSVVAMHQVHDYSHAGATNLTIRADFKSPIIEEENPGRTYNEEVLKRNNQTVNYREGSLDNICLKLRMSHSREFCLEKEKHSSCSASDALTAEEISSYVQHSLCGTIFA